MNKSSSDDPHDNAVPALVRGLEVLRRLADGRPHSFSELAEATRLPKASLTRILQTLVRLGLASRDPASRAFTALARLVPMHDQSRAWDLRIQAALEALTAATGHTSEWYVPSLPPGMVLVARQEPPEGEVAIRARVGFIRAPGPELEAVAVLARASFPVGESDQGSFWRYRKDGIKGALTRAQVAAVLGEARASGLAADPAFNSNGVRRTAALVSRAGSPAGILAVAELAVTPRRKPTTVIARALRQQADGLSGPPSV